MMLITIRGLYRQTETRKEVFTSVDMILCNAKKISSSPNIAVKRTNLSSDRDFNWLVGHKNEEGIFNLPLD
jgi:hypothetical protein